MTSTNALVLRVTAFLALIGFYLLTAPDYHVTAIDSYLFARVIESEAYGTAPLRLFFWVTSMQALHDLVSVWVPDVDAFTVVGVANAVQTALAVLLIERLLSVHFQLEAKAAWATAGLFALSYGTWRYATETEVYANSAFLSSLLLLLSFRLGAYQDATPRRVVTLALVAAAFSLFYQPIGILAGAAIPFYLLIKHSFRTAATYLGTFCLFVAVGILSLRYWRGQAIPGLNQQFLDTDNKVPELPSLADIKLTVLAFGQNLLSANWMFAFGPTRSELPNFPIEFVATEQAHWSYWVFVPTLLLAAALLLRSVAVALRHGPTTDAKAEEACLLVMFLIYAAMVLSLHSDGFEAWLPILVPLILLIGTRLVAPVFAEGHRFMVPMMLGVFLVHNWFAGVGLFAWADQNYNDRGAYLIEQSTTDDLILVGTDWPFEHYLNYASPAETLLAASHPDAVDGRILEALERNGRVFATQDAVEWIRERDGYADANDVIAKLSARHGRMEKIDLGQGTYALQIAN